MNVFLIGDKVRIHHYTDWRDPAFLSFRGEEFRIPGQAARIIVHALRRAQTQPGLPAQADEPSGDDGSNEG